MPAKQLHCGVPPLPAARGMYPAVPGCPVARLPRTFNLELRRRVLSDSNGAVHFMMLLCSQPPVPRNQYCNNKTTTHTGLPAPGSGYL